MDLNSRLDQSLDDIIKENRKQKSQTKAKKRATAAAKKAAATATAAAKASPAGATKATRRKKNASNGTAAAQGSSAGIAARLGSAGSPAKAASKSISGRVGKAKKLESGGRLAGIAEKKKVAELNKRKKVAAKDRAAALNISIKGEAGPATIFITNLDTEASAEDVKTCFKQFGIVKNCTLLYDRSGRASGHAEVVYSSKVAALEAVAKLNGALADGRRLTVQLKPSSKPIAPIPASAQPAHDSASASSSFGHRGGRRTKRSGNGNRMDMD